MAVRLKPARRGWSPLARHPLRFGLLVIAVCIVHGCVTRDLAERMAAFAESARMPPRLEVAYVRTLELEAPQPVAAPAPAPAPVPRARRAPRPHPAASAPEPPASAPAAVAASEPQVAFASEPSASEVAASEAAASGPTAVAASEPVELAASEPAAVAAAAAASAPAIAAAAEPAASASDTVAAAASPSAPSAAGSEPAGIVPARGDAGLRPFDWPASTRVTYQLTGYYRGDVTGSAQVEWIRVGSRYQVNLDFIVGPDFAPIIRRRMTSEGDLTADGLTPTRYDEDTQVAFRDRRRITLRFEGDEVVLANGDRRPRWRGVQDTASQFVQLTYLFTLHPELLAVGRSVEIPLALARSVNRWTYDVLDEVELQTPFGPLPAMHLRPRRNIAKPGDLTAEIWFSPQLRYLPVRIRVEQDAQTYVDLVIARKPELAAR